METLTSSAALFLSTDASTVSGRLKVDQVAFDLVDEYVHVRIGRRGFLGRASKLAATGAAAAMAVPLLLGALTPRFAEAEQVRRNDKRVRAEWVTYDSPAGSGTIRGYLARPVSQNAALPVVLVVHDDRGLNPHIEDITRRLAVAGYLAFAPDALTPLGGSPRNEDKARKLFAKLDPAKTREDFVAAVAFLAPRSDCNGHVGALGFGYGGGLVNTLATRVATLGAAVAFYGVAPELAAVPHVKAPLQLHYAGNDERVNASAPAYEAALKGNHVAYEVYRYPGTQHEFSDDTTPRFDKDAAALAWQRTLDFFQTHLRGSGGTAPKP